VSDKKLRDLLLKSIYRRTCENPRKNVYIFDLVIEFEIEQKEDVLSAVQQLANDKDVIDRGHGYLYISPTGRERAENMITKPSVIQQTLTIGEAHNSPIQQGISSHQSQVTHYELPGESELRKFVDLMRAHLPELNLGQEAERKIGSQLSTIEAQLLDVPNPTIVREAMQTVRSVSEGAVGSLLAAGVQPSVWEFIKSMIVAFS
jgi:hypothetical protein